MSNFPCPCCGSPMREQPEVKFLALDAKLSAGEHAIVRELAASKTPISIDRLIGKIYTNAGGPPDTAKGVIQVMLTRARKKLSPYGWTVSNIHQTGRGNQGRYYLERIK